LVFILLMAIDGYWWLLYLWLLLAILLMVIDAYCIICYIATIGNYYIIGWFKLFFIGYYFLFQIILP
jgi:hypothetical protein